MIQSFACWFSQRYMVRSSSSRTRGAPILNTDRCTWQRIENSQYARDMHHACWMFLVCYLGPWRFLRIVPNLGVSALVKHDNCCDPTEGSLFQVFFFLCKKKSVAGMSWYVVRRQSWSSFSWQLSKYRYAELTKDRQVITQAWVTHPRLSSLHSNLVHRWFFPFFMCLSVLLLQLYCWNQWKCPVRPLWLGSLLLSRKK